MKKLKISKLLFYGSFMTIALVFIFGNLVEAEKKDMSKKLTFENVIEKYEAKIDEIDYLFNVIEWNSYLNSGDEGMAKLLDIYEKKMKDLINDEDNFRRIKTLKKLYEDKNVKGKKRDIVEKWYRYLDRLIVLDPKIKKIQQEVMEKKNKLAGLWNVYRPKMKDKKGRYIKDKETGKPKLFNGSEIKLILAKEPDRAKRARAFEAQSQVGYELNKNGFKDLIKIRNKFARARGYKDFYNMKYAFAGLHEERIFEMFDKIVKETDAITKKAIEDFKKKHNYKEFEPWDADYASLGFSKYIDDYLTKEGMVPATKDSFKRMGMDLDKMNIIMDLEPRAGKFPHAACWGIRSAKKVNGKWQGEESRIMANLDKGGIDQYDTLFHEMGHAVHDVYIRQNHTINNNMNLHYLYDMGPFVEGMAYTLQKVPYEKKWFLEYAMYDGKKKTKVQRKKLEKAFEEFEKASRPWDAFNFRNLLVKVYFERDIYKDPDASFEDIYWKNMKRLLFVKKHEKLPHWSHKMHFITHPVYYQFYVLADMISEQNVHFFKKKYGTMVDNPKVGKLLIKHYFNPGASLSWEKMLENLTGEKLNPQYKIDAATNI